MPDAGVTDRLAAVVLAAGAGTRLRPLTEILPKALCPVGNVALVDLAIDRVRPLTPRIAVNVHHGRALLEAHLAGRVHVSVEEPDVLGTAGALGQVRDWIDGRATVVVNADAWHRIDLSVLGTEVGRGPPGARPRRRPLLRLRDARRLPRRQPGRIRGHERRRGGRPGGGRAGPVGGVAGRRRPPGRAPRRVHPRR